MSNQAPQPKRTPDSAPAPAKRIKLGPLERAQLGFIAAGSFLGIAHPGVVENAGAKVGDAMNDGARVVLEAGATGATAVAKGAEATGAYLGSPAPEAQQKADFDKKIQQKYEQQ